MNKSFTRVPAVAIAGVGLGMALAACGGSSGSSTSTAASSSPSSSSSAPSSSSSSSSAPSSSSSSSSAPSPSSSSAAAAGPIKTVTANEVEFAIMLNTKTFTAGTYTFDVKNGGSATHALEIVGPGVDKSTGDLAAGKSAKLTVTLKPGTYDVNCPVANHKMLGMDLKIKVA